ncbi:MAG: MauE/DoxX family redox-associated membrane protein, partial [Bacteroidota bacterium]
DEYWVVFQDYVSFFPAEFMKTLSVPFAALVSVFEVVVAIALMTGYRMRITALSILLMILFFTFLTGFSAITGTVTDCGCFGDALKLTPTETFIKDLFLTAAVIPIFLLRKRIHPYYRSPIPMAATAASAVIFGAISFYTHQHLPLMDFRGAYKPGQNLAYNSTNFDEEEGQLIAHDFGDFCQMCKQDGFKGATLYIVMYNMEKSSPESLKDAANLQEELEAKAPGVKVCAGTNTGGSVRREMSLPFGETFCLDGYQDEKVLKTIVRSSPGYVFLRDGVVIKKWHLNDVPSVEELRELAGSYADEKPFVPPPPPPPTPDTTAVDSLGTDSLGVDSLNPPQPNATPDPS